MQKLDTQTNKQNQNIIIKSSSRSKKCELFSLSKILRVSSERTLPTSATTEKILSDSGWKLINNTVSIDIVACGGFKGHEFIAIYCSGSKCQRLHSISLVEKKFVHPNCFS
jgi:hypothetical protein